MSKRQIIRRDDYELYSIKMPFLLRKKQRNLYISRQLEKIHPRFSQRCCIDSKYYLSKKGLFASVAVMDTVTLAKYKGKQTARLCLEENRNRIVFSMHNPSLYAFVLCASLTVIFFLSYMLSGLFLGKQQMIEQPLETVTAISLEDDSVLRLSAVLDNICTNKGMLNSLSVLQNQISLETTDCFPEQVIVHEEKTNSLVSNLSYINNEPVFSVSWTRSAQLLYSPVSDPELLSEQLRSLVKKSGVHIQTELTGAAGMICFSELQSFCSFMQSLSDFCLEHDLDFFTFTCTKEGNVLAVSFELARSECVQKIHSLVAMYSLLFTPVTESKPVEIREQTVAWNPVGTVYQKDGSLIRFYLDENGKIKGVYE